MMEIEEARSGEVDDGRGLLQSCGTATVRRRGEGSIVICMVEMELVAMKEECGHGHGTQGDLSLGLCVRGGLCKEELGVIGELAKMGCGGMVWRRGRISARPW